MKVLVTGAAGFIGQVLVRNLLEQGLGGVQVSQVLAMDLGFSASCVTDPRLETIVGSVSDAPLLRSVTARPIDVVFHLASLPGGAAEENYSLGRQVNLDATLQLIEALQSQTKPARFVYASSIAVYGEELPACVDEHTVPAPALTYGVHKLACEGFVADATRRGWLQGCSLRLPGVVARPGDGAGLMSAFMSQIFWRMAANQALTVPVTREGTAWWISAQTCADNLIHAAVVDPKLLRASRVYLMPALHLSVGEVLAALGRRFGADREALMHFAPDALIQKLFASFPPMDSSTSRAVGFQHDGSADRLVERACG